MEAKDCKCCVCGRQAVAFWPLMDPDIPSQPFCRECLDKQKIKLLIELFGYEKKAADTHVKYWNKENENRD